MYLIVIYKVLCSCFYKSHLASLYAKWHVEQIISSILPASARTKQEVLFPLTQQIIISFSQPEYLTYLSHLYICEVIITTVKYYLFMLVVIYSKESWSYRKSILRYKEVQRHCLGLEMKHSIYVCINVYILATKKGKVWDKSNNKNRNPGTAHLKMYWY